ncbi:hypothetical protein NDU88_002560 [Pleurodeles waltl]|uniref:Uncharacterized protein n=1 Tax=Pleurodeles waltl TaxID=8319 RepID=A0AAV7NGV7_PLEWA|nr:hypothetical protein NDU88_002560 [Pleurodeles waltl]
MELQRRIIDRVNAMGQHPRTRDDIRMRWNDLWGKARSVVSRHQIAVQRTGGGPPPPPPQLITWEEQVLPIMHPEGLAGVAGGLDSGPPPNITGEEVPPTSSTPPEEAHSDDSSSAQLDHDDQPGPSGTSGQSQTTTEHPPLTQWAHTSVPRTRQSAECPPLQGPQATPQTQDDQEPGVSGSGHMVQGTEAQDNREAGRTAMRQGEDRPREPTLPEALSNIMGAYHHSQETMGTVLAKLQETQWLQEGQYLGIREDLTKIYTILITIAGVLADMGKTMREAVAHQRAPDSSQTEEEPSTSAGASGQEAPPRDQQATSTPPPAEGEPPHKRSLRSRQ